MAGKIPSTIDFGSLSKAKSGLEKIAYQGVGKKRGITALESHEKTAGRVTFLKSSTKSIKASPIGRKSKGADFSHLTGNKRADPNKSVVTRAAEELGLSKFWTKDR